MLSLCRLGPFTYSRWQAGMDMGDMHLPMADGRAPFLFRSSV